ncbi:MAG TPA: glycoside hydrolase family 3 C-terminal domain-containing protein [Pyrinomonadaceae bacterium]|nr:glycoside hydrolase family 3 C-terminal domain-containing protein [Pyrinomonadaceae bacterium]
MKNRCRVAACLLLLLVCRLPVLAQSRGELPPYKNPALPIERRVADLISRMTLEEKVSQMLNSAPAVERLDIPAYDWWNEALHGVARAGYATVFPQAIGLAATWNPDLMRRVADAISTEARAKYNEAQRRNERGRYKGLTFWSPNVNIFRDPRWGRGQETYGEDPYLTSILGVAFVRGLQGDHPRYLKVVSTPKHYAVHSGPEPERHSFDAQASERDMRETYLPAFRATVVEGRAEGVMCAYNRTNGEPACANQRLFDILRREWAFKGHVVSDCGAIEDIYKGHHFAGSEAEASAVAVKVGTDLSCGGEYRSLVKAVKEGLITEREIDVSLRRLMTTRFRLGMFDPPEMVPFSRITLAENDSPAHRRLALQAARESIVLLKNENQTLPFSKELKTVAVIGPNADAPGVLLGNYNGQPSSSTTPLQGIRDKMSPNARVIYALGSTLTGEEIAPVPAAGFRGEYFDNKELKDEPVLTRENEQVNFDWDRGRVAPRLPYDNFSARWTGKFVPTESGTYQLGATADDGVRVYLDGKLLVDNWTNSAPYSPPRTATKEVKLEAGRAYDVRLEYYDNTGPAVVKFVWSFPRLREKLVEEAVAAARQSDAVVLVLGIAPSLEGEEMKVLVKGFRGGDRTDLSLPAAQEELLKAVTGTGKPVALVLMSGSALAVNWANENVPAILEAWYPGEEGGAAVADVLFGDYNPAGRLPVTFYKSADDLPPFTEYGMRGRTYRYFKNDPLYPFGHGLSYTRFVYGEMKMSATSIRAGASVRVSVDVTNYGQRAGDEVVQLYVTDVAASVPVPVRSLQGVRRVSLRPGEKRIVSFTLTPSQLSVIDDRGRRVVEPGDFLIIVGGKQPGFKGTADARSTDTITRRLVVTGKTTEVSD